MTQNTATQAAVAHIIDSTNIGGAERMAINYVNDLATSGRFKPHLLVTRSHGQGQHLVSPDVATHVFHKQTAFDVRALLRFIQYLRKNNIQVLHAHSTSIFWGIIAKKVIPRLRLIWHDHLGARASRNDRFMQLTTLFGKGIDAYLGVTDAGVNWASSTLPNKQMVSMLLENYPVLPMPKPVAERRFQKQPDTVVFLALGNFRPEKNQIGLVQSFKQVSLSLPQARLWLAGKPIDADYHQQVTQSIQALGLVDSVTDWGACADVADLIACADVAVIPSVYEGLPVALLEFGLLRKPVVATAVGRIPEILGNGSRGLLVGPEDEKAMATAMVNMATDSKLAAFCGEGLFTYVHAHFSSTVALQKLEKLYSELNT